MTRMLCTLLAYLLIVSTFTGCSLFDSDDTASVSDVDKESASTVEGLGDENLLDAEDEMLAESSDLAQTSDDEFINEIEGPEESEPEDDFAEELDDSSLDQEMQTAELSDDNEDDFTEDEFSETNDFEVDQELAKDEFTDFEDDFQAIDNTTDEFAVAEDMTEEEPVAEEPVIDVPDEGTPIVDVPEEESTPIVASNQVTNLEYKAFENGGTVVIETAQPATYQKIVDPERNQIIIQVNEVGLPARFQRPYITKDFKQDIATINAYADETGNARFVIQMKRPVDPAVTREGKSILVMTSESAFMSFAANKSNSPETKEESLNQLVSENEFNEDVGEAGKAKVLGEIDTSLEPDKPKIMEIKSNDGSISGLGDSKSGLSLNEGVFRGDPISLEFVDEDVRTIIEVIADKSGLNLIMDKEVSGQANLRLRDVPWDQALLVLLRSQGLGYVKQGSVLRIAKQSTLSSEAKSVSDQIKSEKQAKLLSSGIKVKYIPVSYAKVAELAPKLKEFTSKEGKIAFDDRTSSLVITDFGEYIARIEELVKALDTPPMQVEIESKLIEAREDFVREAGINWGIAGQPFDVNSQTAAINAGLNNVQATTGFSMDLSIGTFDIFGDLTAALNIFENQNKIKVLSQPRVVTMNKVPAVIEQVTQIPILQITVQQGITTETIQFQDLTLSLNVTPQITFKGDVILDVELKREFAGTQAQDGTRELNRRRAKTTVMVKNGKTAVIGGVYQLDDTDIDSGIPGLKDIPLIGYLFKSTREERSKNELLLFLKPKILKEIEGPMVSKAATTNSDPNYDPFEELSVDEGDNSESELNLDEVEQGIQEEELSEDVGELSLDDVDEFAEPSTEDASTSDDLVEDDPADTPVDEPDDDFPEEEGDSLQL